MPWVDGAPNWTRLRALIDWTAQHQDRISEVIAERPAPQASPMLAGLLASVAEKVADDHGLRRPRWTASVPPPGRSAPLAGRVGVEVAALLLLNPDEPAAVRRIAGLLGRAPSSVSQVLSSMQAAALLDEQRKPTVPELFWELAARWRPSHADVQAVPSPNLGAVNEALKLGLKNIEATTGWALSDTMAAATYGAPVSVRSDHPLDFYVPDAATLRRAVTLLGVARDHDSRAATVRTAPVPMICGHRVDATSWADEVWPLAQPLFVALDLAQDPGRGREVLDGWTPGHLGHRVW
jgi:hypothetical protein